MMSEDRSVAQKYQIVCAVVLGDELGKVLL